MVAPVTERFTALDGTPLGADLFLPERPKAALLVGSATGVPRRLYRALCENLSDHGYAAMTFDYRGVGDSRPASLKGYAARAQDWGEHDLGGALKYWGDRHPNLPLLYLGHSIGGQLLGLAPAREQARVRAALLVAAQSGYWRLWPAKQRLRMFLNWYALIPGMAAAFGYLPMKRFSGGEDIPAGVAREWASWGRHPDYILSNARARETKGFEQVRVPLCAYAFTDDSYAPPAAAEALTRCYRNALTEQRVVSPQDLGVARVGHFGCFKAQFQETFWRQVREWLDRQSAPRAVNPER